MKQEKRISYKAGITRTPSDFLCSDGELAECVDLATDNEELKPVVKPADYITSFVDSGNNPIDAPVILFVHRFNNTERFIGYRKQTYYDQTLYPLCWFVKDGTDEKKLVWQNDFSSNGSVYYTSSTKIVSVGKVLLVSDSNGIKYFLWKYNEYSQSIVIPQPDVDFCLTMGRNTSASGQFGDALDGNNIKDQERWNDLLTGLYAKNLKNLAHNKEFCKPFLVRVALELYDGSYYYITHPMMMFGCVKENSWGMRRDEEVSIHTDGCELQMLQNTDYTPYSDIVKDVVVFVTEGIETHELDTDQTARFIDSGQSSAFTDKVVWLSTHSEQYGMTYYKTDAPDNGYPIFQPLKQKSADDIKMELESSSIFYKLCSLGISPYTTWTKLKKHIKPHVVENITTQPRLDQDDWYSRCSLKPEFLFAYNGRVNMAGVERGFFEGFGKFLPYTCKGIQQVQNDRPSYYPPNDHTSYDFYVRIETDDGDVYVKHTEAYTNSHCRYYQGIYFFYPDPRAKHVWIYDNNGNCVCNEGLKENSGLNGAYFFKGLPGWGGEEETVTYVAPPSYNNSKKELLANYVLTTEVYNPWVVTSKGYNRVGLGRIYAMSAVTMALAQDQFGKTDLVVFSESGVWGMQVDRTGMYESVHPFTRDRLLNKNSVTQTDGAVFFVSKKGLMVVSETGVRCVSEQMNGRVFDLMTLPGFGAGGIAAAIFNENNPLHPWARLINQCAITNITFLDFIRDEGVRMAYDYIDSRLLIFNPSYRLAFCYSLADGSISMQSMPAIERGEDVYYPKVCSVVNDYPDYLLQAAEWNNLGTAIYNKIYTLYGKPREDEVTTRQTAFLLTRPMKLGGPLTVTSLRELVNVGWWSADSKVKTEVWLSDDLHHWYAMASRFGVAAKYFRIGLYLSMLPSERLSGTIIAGQDRRTNNMRTNGKGVDNSQGGNEE